MPRKEKLKTEKRENQKDLRMTVIEPTRNPKNHESKERQRQTFQRS